MLEQLTTIIKTKYRHLNLDVSCNANITVTIYNRGTWAITIYPELIHHIHYDPPNLNDNISSAVISTPAIHTLKIAPYDPNYLQVLHEIINEIVQRTC